jgi:CHASE3 domain sensor protein
MIRKALLQIGAPALLAFMAWNAYLAVNHLEQMQHIAARTLESSMIQASISNVLKDLTDMETSQRGYLLTENPSYLQPYTNAKRRIETDFVDFRVGLANRAGANGPRSRSSSLWPIQSKVRWSTLLLCANRGIATAHSC